MFSSIVVRPVDHAHGPRVVKSGHTVVALRESQADGHYPNQCNHNLCRGGGEAGLQGVDDGHVPERGQKHFVHSYLSDVYLTGTYRNLGDLIKALPCVGVCALLSWKNKHIAFVPLCVTENSKCFQSIMIADMRQKYLTYIWWINFQKWLTHKRDPLTALNMCVNVYLINNHW